MKIKLHDDKIAGSPWKHGWWRTVTVTRDDGTETTYRVGVYTDGKPRRIAYRGNQRGYHWYGCVMHEGKSIWEGRVGKSLGVRGVLKRAEII